MHLYHSVFNVSFCIVLLQEAHTTGTSDKDVKQEPADDYNTEDPCFSINVIMFMHLKLKTVIYLICV